MFLFSLEGFSTWDILLYLAGWAVLIWICRALFKAFPIRAGMFDPFRSSWPTTQAVVTRTSRRHFRRIRGSISPGAVVYVWFQYQVEGVKYVDAFTAAIWPADERFDGDAVGETLLIRYNPRKHSDALPVESRWHNLKVWWQGTVGST